MKKAGYRLPFSMAFRLGAPRVLPAARSGAWQHVARRDGEDAFGGFAQQARFAVGPQGHDGIVAA